MVATKIPRRSNQRQCLATFSMIYGGWGNQCYELKDPTVIIVWLLKKALKNPHKHESVVAKQKQPRSHSEDSADVLCPLGCTQTILDSMVTCILLIVTVLDWGDEQVQSMRNYHFSFHKELTRPTVNLITLIVEMNINITKANSTWKGNLEEVLL